MKIHIILSSIMLLISCVNEGSVNEYLENDTKNVDYVSIIERILYAFGR